ncbi:MAG TPA: hypothetical protein VGU72_00590 [Beijerinckiaceae bacterium]|jgi:drug/metabolite transporter (DMT)-like permease|nr:hypothetical protein [Beijerinckiaceae bacterium]
MSAPTSQVQSETAPKNLASPSLAGPLLILVFAVSQALRDVYFGFIFQRVDFFAVLLIAFGLSALGFGLWTLLREPEQIAILRKDMGAVVAMNVTTALAWSCFFFALSQIEPAIVNTIHSGMAPLTVLALAAFGIKLGGSGATNRLERLSYGVMAASLVALWVVVLSGASGAQGKTFAGQLAALAALLVSGSMITLSLLYSKRLHDIGATSASITSVRYLLTIVLAAAMTWHDTRQGGGLARIDGFIDFTTIAIAAVALIVIPLFALQAGIGRTPHLTGQVIRALGPVLVFAAQPLDSRLSWSTPTLLCICVYSAAIIAANVFHGWRRS